MQSASTAASSIAIAAPWARNGSIGWAASPSSVTGPSPQWPQRRHVVERPFLPAVRQRERSRAGAHQRHGEKCASSSSRSPARGPAGLATSASSTIATMLISAPALHRIVHEMRVAAEPELDVAARGIPRRPWRPEPARATRCAGQTAASRACAEPRPQAPTTGRRRRSARCPARRRCAARLRHAARDAVANARRSLPPWCRAAA